jgi:hypothetical protein
MVQHKINKIIKHMKNQETKKLGRPTNPNSVRQQQLKAKAELKASGVVIKRGRPVVEGSKNQMKLERRSELAGAGLLTGKRGRPVDPNSPRQQRMQMLAEKRASGTLKLGRPKVKKD